MSQLSEYELVSDVEGSGDEDFTGEYVGERSEEGKYDGKGKCVLQNRDQYDGDYCDGLRDGRGCYYYFKSGARYDGQWKMNMKHGRGKFNFPDGSCYNGDWKQNKKHGFGFYSYRNGDIYEGMWKQNIKHGIGVYKFKNADVSFKATWINGAPKGSIEIYYQTFRYHGYWNGIMPIGQGTFTFDMKYILSGYVESMPNPDYITETDDSHDKSTIAKCIPRFNAQEVSVFNHSMLPQQQMPPPQSDSEASFCTKSSNSETELNEYQINSLESISALK